MQGNAGAPVGLIRSDLSQRRLKHLADGSIDSGISAAHKRKSLQSFILGSIIGQENKDVADRRTMETDELGQTL